MRVQNKKTIVLLLLTGCVLLGYWFYLLSRPVELVNVHNNGHYSDVLVRNFPFTDKGKIRWWQQNKDILKKLYNIPTPDEDGFFSVTVWLFGNGYKEAGKYDRLCFDGMKKKEHCIEKDAVLTVSNSKNRGTIFTVYDGTYRLKENGDLIKIESD